MLHLLPSTATIKRKTASSYATNNDPVETSTTVATVRCRVCEGTSKEGVEPHMATVTSVRIYLPVCDVTEDDVITVDGVDYRIIGVTDVTGFLRSHHYECDVLRVET